MVDVSHKPALFREAVASGEIRLRTETLDLVETDQVSKGNVLATARLAGIQAAKRTGELIPLCHPLPITHCGICEDGLPLREERVRGCLRSLPLLCLCDVSVCIDTEPGIQI